MPTITISTTPSASFVAQRAAYDSYPYIYVTIKLPTDEVAIDITDRVISVSSIDRATVFEPGSLSTVRVGDMSLKLSNDDGYFSPFNSVSLFYDKIYFNSEIKVYAGFYIDTDSVEVMLQSTTLLESMKVDDVEGIASLYGMGKSKKTLEKALGEPNEDGTTNALSFMGLWKFTDIIAYIMENEAGLLSTDYSVDNLPLYFNNVVFNDVPISDALAQLAQVANCRVYEDSDGTIIITEFTPAFGSTGTVVDLADYSKGATFSADYQHLVNKVNVQYSDNQYYKKDNTNVVADAQRIIVNNSLLTDNTVARDIGDKIIAKYGSSSNIATLIVESTWLPDKDIGTLFFCVSSLLGLTTSAYFNTYRISQDLTRCQTTLYLERSNIGDGNWGYLGSTADEGDSASPQDSSYDTATDADKLFAYCSTTGSIVAPLYYAY